MEKFTLGQNLDLSAPPRLTGIPAWGTYFVMKPKTTHAALILTSVVCLLPVILSLALYNDLPDRVVMQWDIQGNPNWYAHKAVAAFGLPLFMVVINIFVMLAFRGNPKRENVSRPLQMLMEWITPATSVIVVPIILLMAAGAALPVPTIALVLVGVIFVAAGLYLPKTGQNFVVGIRLPWTLRDTETWDKTHRMAGPLWIACGIALILITFLPLSNSATVAALLVILALLIVAPVLYSYVVYKRQKSA